MANFVILEDGHSETIVNLDAISWIDLNRQPGGRRANTFCIGVGEEIIVLHSEQMIDQLMRAIDSNRAAP